MPEFEISTKIKADKEIKAGEEIEYKGKVQVDQAAFDAQVKDRLTREREKITADLTKQHQEALDKIKAEGAGSKGADEATMKRLKELEDQIAQNNTEKQLQAKLQELGANGLDPIIREQIKVKAGASADEIEAAVKKALADNEALLKRLGVDPKKKQDEPAQGGFTGSGGSIDANMATEITTLEQKLIANRPDLKGMVIGISGARKLALLKEYDAKGYLNPRGKK
jgi:hypothetical protein